MLVDTIQNWWLKTKILSPDKVKDLYTNIRRNKRMALDKSSGQPSDIIADSPSEMLKSIGKK